MALGKLENEIVKMEARNKGHDYEEKGDRVRRGKARLISSVW